MYLQLAMLIFLPAVFGLVYLAGNKKIYKPLSYLFFAVNSVLAVSVALQGTARFQIEGHFYSLIEGTILVLEAALIVMLLIYSIMHKRRLTLALVCVQILLLLYPMFLKKGEHSALLNVDKLSIIMLLVVNIVGSLIVIFANNYIEEYEHHRHMKSKQRWFYFIISCFLSAMNGLVIADTLSWVYFFWEVTTVASFLLISFNGDEEAYKSAFRALSINLFGGICFGLGNILFHELMGVTVLSQLTDIGVITDPVALFPVFLLCLAGFSKSAQAPFQSWLLGAMVAPTPVSALLHSSTMVKAGVYLVIKLAPCYASTHLGSFIAVYGAFVFLICSAIAISQSNAKRVLAYSTIANLGLIISSAGIGTPVAISAAIIFIVFHAISKALLFLCTGQIEHTIGSRDIEDMSGLVRKAPWLAVITAFGIISMILPPFGVLITKWLSIEASAKSPLVVILLILGSALTTFYYIKWIGALLSTSISKTERNEHTVFSIYAPLAILCILAVVTSALVTPLFNSLVSPEVNTLIGANSDIVASNGKIISSAGAFNDFIIFAFSGMLGIAALFMKFSKVKVKNIYLCGENNLNDKPAYFRQGNGEYVQSNISNLYMSSIFNEKKLTAVGYIASICLLLLIAAGGVL